MALAVTAISAVLIAAVGFGTAANQPDRPQSLEATASETIATAQEAAQQAVSAAEAAELAAHQSREDLERLLREFEAESDEIRRRLHDAERTAEALSQRVAALEAAR